METPKKISALDQTPSLPPTGEFPVSIDGVTWKATIEQLVVLAGGIQTLSYNSTTGALTISGANTVNIPLGPRKFVSEITSIGGGVPVTFTHGFGTRDLDVTVWDTATNTEILGPVEADTDNTIKITAQVDFDVRVVIIG